jgi:hypothetical protein
VFSLEKDYRFGIASVPDIATSHKLRKYFETNKQLLYDRTKKNDIICTICNKIGHSSISKIENEIRTT